MALYAVDEDDLILAAHAERGKNYFCVECFAPVRVRRGKDRFPHFYHIASSPRCRLYSKSEDHLRVQIELQKIFPEGALQIERPFLEIGRVADLCWEDRKIVFEIQCSPLEPKEAESRIGDYRSSGYRAVWLLDDRRYNRRIVGPAEELLRGHACYFVRIRQGLESIYYDQFEVLAAGKRVRRGFRMKIDLQKPFDVPRRVWEEGHLPRQALRLGSQSPLYFRGDRIHKALLSFKIPTIAIAMQNWIFLERHYAVLTKKTGAVREWLKRWIERPYSIFLIRLLQRVSTK